MVRSVEQTPGIGRWPKGLMPPQDTWRKNPGIEKIKTPTDARGLIDLPQLLEDVKRTISPDYEWYPRSDCHHLYWPRAKYPNTKENDGLVTPPAFGELPTQKTMMSREFHNWLHRITLPPDKPSAKVMEEVTEEFWSDNEDLFYDTRDALFLQQIHLQQRTKNLGNIASGLLIPGSEKYEHISELDLEEIDNMRIEKLLRIQQHLGELAITPDQFVLDNDKDEDITELVTLQLGKIVAPGVLNLVNPRSK